MRPQLEIIKEGRPLQQPDGRQDEARVVSSNRRRAAGITYYNAKAEILRALVFVALKEVEQLSEQSSEEDCGEPKLSEIMRRIEAEIIRAALVRTGGRQRRAAHLLGVKVPTLIAKIKRYNINLMEIINGTVNLT